MEGQCVSVQLPPAAAQVAWHEASSSWDASSTLAPTIHRTLSVGGDVGICVGCGVGCRVGVVVGSGVNVGCADGARVGSGDGRAVEGAPVGPSVVFAYTVQRRVTVAWVMEVRALLLHLIHDAVVSYTPLE